MQQSQWRDKHKTTSWTEIMKCERCWKEMTRKNSKQKYCIKCGNIVNREWTRDRARERAKLRKHKKES